LISGKSRASVYFHQSQSRKKELGLLKKTIPVAGFLLGFVSETIVILQIIHLTFILLFSKCPFSKGSFCIKSICKNNFLYLFIPICMLSTLLVGGRDISVVQHMARVFFSVQLQIIIAFLNNTLFKFKFGRYVDIKKLRNMT
jgi:hypothetical protein